MIDPVTIPGCVFVFMICAWGVWFLSKQLWSNIKTDTAVDRTLSEVKKEDNPGMFGLQVLGFVLLIVAAAAIGIGAVVALVQSLLNANIGE